MKTIITSAIILLSILAIAGCISGGDTGTIENPFGTETVSFTAFKPVASTVYAGNTLTLYLQVQGTTVSLFGYSYPLVAPLLRPDTSLLPLASREDIVAMKLAAIASRGSRKDFIDLWLLATRYWPLPDCLELYRRKFAARDIGHVVRSLTYFDDADEEPPLRLLIDVDWEEIKRDLVSGVRELLSPDTV